MNILLDKNKPFFKANLHCHSTYSDGKESVEELKRQYKRQGYSIVAFTEHEHLIDNSRLNDEEFLAITACELAIKEFPEQSTMKNFDMRVCHLNLYSLDPHNTLTPCYSPIQDHFISDTCRHLIRYDTAYERVYSKEGINDIIRIANEQGFLVTYNHPTWSLETANEYLQYDNLFAVEIYNHGCNRMGARVDDERVFDDMLRAGKRLFCVCADDNHTAEDSFGGWVCVNAEKLDYTTIMTALRNGQFYASTGPQIFALTQDGMQVEIYTSPCKTIGVTTHGRRTDGVCANDGELLTHAKFTLRPEDKYFRIRVTDKYGKTAYTQAYPLQK